MTNKLILIAGGTASGKTEIAKNVSASLSDVEKSVTYISMDNYYRSHIEIGQPKEKINWDLPSAIHWEDLIADLTKLMNGSKISRKKYDFELCDYIDEDIIIEPNEYLILEGLFALYDDRVVKKSNITFFVTASSLKRLKRRIIRDKEIRYSTFNDNEFVKKWEADIEPSYRKYIKPTKDAADIIIKNNNDDDPNASDSVGIILKILK